MFDLHLTCPLGFRSVLPQHDVEKEDCMLTVRDVSERLNCSIGLVYKVINQGKLKAHRINSAFRISEQHLQEFLADAAEPSPEPPKRFTTRFL